MDSNNLDTINYFRNYLDCLSRIDSAKYTKKDYTVCEKELNKDYYNKIRERKDVLNTERIVLSGKVLYNVKLSQN